MSFPSPAMDYREEVLDFNRKLILTPAATYTMQMRGAALEGIGIFDGDLLLMDRSLRPKRRGALVVVRWEGEMLVRQIAWSVGKGVILSAAHCDYPDIHVTKAIDELDLMGVITWSLHNHLIMG